MGTALRMGGEHGPVWMGPDSSALCSLGQPGTGQDPGQVHGLCWGAGAAQPCTGTVCCQGHARAWLMARLAGGQAAAQGLLGLGCRGAAAQPAVIQPHPLLSPAAPGSSARLRCPAGTHGPSARWGQCLLSALGPPRSSLVMLPPPALVPGERASSAGGSNGSKWLLMGRDGGGRGGAVVSAFPGARPAAAQGQPGRCWMGSCSGCSSPWRCAPASAGQVQLRSLNSSSPSLLGPCPLRAAPASPCWRLGLCGAR